MYHIIMHIPYIYTPKRYLSVQIIFKKSRYYVNIHEKKMLEVKTSQSTCTQKYITVMAVYKKHIKSTYKYAKFTFRRIYIT